MSYLKRPFARISLSSSMTQCMPRSLIALESWMCMEENLPFLQSKTFTESSATDIAIINTVRSSVSVIIY